MDRIARYLIPTAFIVAIAFLRLLPHPPNLVPMTAICLFAGGQQRNRLWRFAVPLLAVLMTDVLQGTNLSLITAFTYIGYAAIVAIGRTLQTSKKLSRLLPTSLVGSLVFFVVSNFGFWMFTQVYPHTLSGLTTCYVRGLPFLLNSLVADAFYVVCVFAGYEFVKQGIVQSEQWVSASFHNNNVQA